MSHPRAVALRVVAISAALSLAAAAAPAARAAEPAIVPRASAPPPPVAGPARPRAAEVAAADDELIEFLGSVGDTDDDGDWLDFLTKTDIDKVAKRGTKTPPSGSK